MTQHLSDELLQRHHDGDLSSSEEAEARAHLERCSECRAQVAALQRLRLFLQLSADEAAHDADFEGMFARIERAADGTSGSAQGKEERSAQVAQAPAPAPAKVRRIRPMGPALGALAIAAAALLMVFREGPPADDAGGEPQGEQLAMLPGRSEIVEIDFGNNAGTVFDIALEDGSSVPVVWINDEDE